MRIECARESSAQVVRPYGILAGSDADGLESQVVKMLDAGPCQIVIDISGLLFVDSRGLETLVNLAERQIRDGRKLKLAGNMPVLQQVLELTELAALFELHRDVKAAVESCQ